MIGETDENECDHENPAATLFNGSDETPHILCGCGYADDEVDGEFTVEWHRTDAWRGYNEVRPAEESRWVEVHDDNILSMSQDADMLAAFDRFIRSAMDRAGIEYVRAFATSSNLFSMGYTLFVERPAAKRVERLIEKAKPNFRDSRRYFETAITGKDSKDMEPRDRTFALLAAAILSGMGGA